jgi:hypothetical protein
MMIADEFEMSKEETVRKILVQYLGMSKLAAKLMLQNLKEEQKDRCLILCMDFADQLQENNFLDHVITGDETWCVISMIQRPNTSR